MDRQYTILKGDAKSKTGTNSEVNLNVDLVGNHRILPENNLVGNVDQYEQYIKEKDACTRFNMIFTVNMIASNVLFNRVSEIVANEGSSDCIFFGKSGVTVNSGNIGKYYREYKKNTDGNLNRYEMLRDTAYSHKDLGGVVYHCGYDIFGNHTLRKRGFGIVNKLSDDEADPTKCQDFNTISDYSRDFYGDIIQDNLQTISGKDGTHYKVDSGLSDTHQYFYDSVYSINNTIRERLIEKDGWFGFINPSSMYIENVKIGEDEEIVVNKCMNNNKACEQIDMYPDRSLFSLAPKYNKYRRRVENNWDYCITYPYKSLYDHQLVRSKKIGVPDGEEWGANGLECTMLTRNQALLFYYDEDWNLQYKDNVDILFSTNVQHNLNVNDKIRMWVKRNGKEYVFDTEVTRTGINGEYGEYFFCVNSSAFAIVLDDVNDIDYGGYPETMDYGFVRWDEKRGDEIRFARVVRGKPCDYYLRLFKKLPNFKNTDVYEDGCVSDEEINKYASNPLSSSLNNLAFSNNIYGDPIGQIIFNDDVNIYGLKDNLGRDLSEVYLTLIKSNKGYKEWYEGKNYGADTVEYSHCFGKITAGFDLMPYVEDYNVHRIHNVNLDAYEEPVELFFRKMTGLEDSVLSLEGDTGEVTYSGDTYFDDFKNEDEKEKNDTEWDNLFFGDIAEFSQYDVKETVLEPVQFRFNTAQREYTKDNEFYDFDYEDIVEDDYKLFDIRGANNSGTKFMTEKRTFNNYDTPLFKRMQSFYCLHYPFNVVPEGYYYSPHIRVPVREFSDTIKQGSHIQMIYEPEDWGYDCGREGNDFYIQTAKNYYMNEGDKILLYKDGEMGEPIEGRVISVAGRMYNHLHIKLDKELVLYSEMPVQSDKNKGKQLRRKKVIYYRMFKYNIDKPIGAIEMNDGTGNYLWRPFKSEKNMTRDDELYDRPFLNGRIYVHNFVDVFLRRQDPYNEYNLQCEGINDLAVFGDYKDISKYEAVEPVQNKICGQIFADYLTDAANIAGTIAKDKVSSFNIDKLIDSYRSNKKAKKDKAKAEAAKTETTNTNSTQTNG